MNGELDTMPVFEIYSKRQNRLNNEMPDIFQYENFPESFRIQVMYLINDALGEPKWMGGSKPTHEAYKFIHFALCREYGELSLIEGAKTYKYSINKFLLTEQKYGHILDTIELTFQHIEKVAGDYAYRATYDPSISPEEAVQELNYRFLENGIGYQFESGKIIRLDNTFTHYEIIIPALSLLSDPKYNGPNDEYLSACDHYKHRRYKECLNDCLKAFESTMKVICINNKWEYLETDTANRLLQICFERELIPSYLQSHFSSLRASLESGVPTIRNRRSGHGQGQQKIIIPQYLARYLLNLTATTIIFLIEAERCRV